jgi:hypothetical protein
VKQEGVRVDRMSEEKEISIPMLAMYGHDRCGMVCQGLACHGGAGCEAVGHVNCGGKWSQGSVV